MQSKREKAGEERSEANGETRQRGSDNRERRGEMMGGGGGRVTGGRRVAARCSLCLSDTD